MKIMLSSLFLLFWPLATFANLQCFSDIFSYREFTFTVPPGTANDPFRDANVTLFPPENILDLNSQTARIFSARNSARAPIAIRRYENLYELPKIEVDIDYQAALTAGGMGIRGPRGTRAFLGRIRGTQQMVITLPFYNGARARAEAAAKAPKTLWQKFVQSIIGDGDAFVGIYYEQKTQDAAALQLANFAVQMAPYEIFPRLIGVSKDNSGNHYLSFEFFNGRILNKFTTSDLVEMEGLLFTVDQMGIGGLPTIRDFIKGSSHERNNMLNSYHGLQIFRAEDGRMMIFPNGGFDVLPSTAVISPHTTDGALAFKRATALLNTDVAEGLKYLELLKQMDTQVNPGSWHGVLGVLEILAQKGVQVPQEYLDIAENR